MPKLGQEKYIWPSCDINSKFVWKEEEYDLQKRKITHKCGTCHTYHNA